MSVASYFETNEESNFSVGKSPSEKLPIRLNPHFSKAANKHTAENVMCEFSS
jgi:hypothetical protein